MSDAPENLLPHFEGIYPGLTALVEDAAASLERSERNAAQHFRTVRELVELLAELGVKCRAIDGFERISDDALEAIARTRMLLDELRENGPSDIALGRVAAAMGDVQITCTTMRDLAGELVTHSEGARTEISMAFYRFCERRVREIGADAVLAGLDEDDWERQTVEALALGASVGELAETDGGPAGWLKARRQGQGGSVSE